LVRLQPETEYRTRLEYSYEAELGGKLAAVGQRMLGSVMRYLISQFFRALERRITPASRTGWRSWWLKLRRYVSREET
jgi:carbon monoxide dehydrogenase subunit G